MKFFILFAILATSLADIPCPLGYFDGTDGSCYGIKYEKVNRLDAKRRCAADNAVLAPITDGFINSKIGTLLTGNPQMWIGNYCLNNTLCYTDDGVKTSFNNKYSNDNNLFPLMIASQYYWQSTSNPLIIADGYICKITPDNSRCPVNFYQSGNTCFSVVSNPITWPQSAQFCTFMSSQLAKIDSDIDNRFAVGLLRSKGFKDGFASIGLTVDSNNVATWSNNTAPTYTNLATDTPYLGQCTALNINSSLSAVGQWTTNPCDHTNQATLCTTAATSVPVPLKAFNGQLPDACTQIYYAKFQKTLEITSPLYSNSLNLTTYPSNTCTTVVQFDTNKGFSVQFSQLSLPANGSYVELSGSLVDTSVDKIRLSGSTITGGASPNKVYNFTTNTLVLNFYSPMGSYSFKAKVF